LRWSAGLADRIRSVGPAKIRKIPSGIQAHPRPTSLCVDQRSSPSLEPCVGPVMSKVDWAKSAHFENLDTRLQIETTLCNIE
jgi:hypothetical protein